MDATRYLNSVAWRTYSKSVILLSSESDSVPATYRVTVSPIDVNEPGAALSDKEIGYFYKDYVGHTYSIIDTGITTIDISDDFRCGSGPQSGQQAILYKSVWKGRSPYLAPIYYRHLDRVALEYSRQFELDILWSNDPNAKRISISSTNTPTITGYQSDQLDGFNLAEDYGEMPKVKLFQTDGDNLIERSERPYFSYIGGLIDSITFGILDETSEWIIEISK